MSKNTDDVVIKRKARRRKSLIASRKSSKAKLSKAKSRASLLTVIYMLKFSLCC